MPVPMPLNAPSPSRHVYVYAYEAPPCQRPPSAIPGHWDDLLRPRVAC